MGGNPILKQRDCNLHGLFLDTAGRSLGYCSRVPRIFPASSDSLDENMGR
jgi:hypothetical protein